MQTTTTYLDRVRPAITQVGERFAALVTAAPDPQRKVPHSPDWTIQEAAAHVVTVAPRYADGPERRGTWVTDPQALPELNQAQIQALGTHSTAELADRLRLDLAALCDQIEGYGTAPPSFRFHGGELVPADVALGILLGELVVHGWDIAQAVRQPWPIDPGHVALILDGLAPIVPGWVDPERARGFTATFKVRLRGQATYTFAFQDGCLQVNPGGERPVDTHISADPAALLLVLYRRQSQWKHIAAGRLLAWGRKPWLALTFVGRFHQP
ncbi:MAG TPA: maleylpyruvate isomerase family mycothiol-dependent enzyme [Actinomycetota bacterium]|nr:maleylpyruvate isomerase family mycothiol-dependent enzyme [Actinomycetota bacterium]